MNPPCTLGVFPDKKMLDPPKVLSVNRLFPARESFCQGNSTTVCINILSLIPLLFPSLFFASEVYTVNLFSAALCRLKLELCKACCSIQALGYSGLEFALGLGENGRKTCNYGKIRKSLFHFNWAPETKKWKRISCKQSARWQHLSQLKAGVLLSR